MKPETLRELDRWKNLDFTPAEEDHSGYRSDSEIVVIGGCGRSGTTLLRVILDSHHDIACGPESLLFLPLPIDCNDLSWKFQIPVEELEFERDRASSRGEFIDWFQRRYLQLRGRTLWADKTGRNIHCFGKILEHFPRAKLLHAVRDGRDVVCSLRTHRKRKVVDGRIVPTDNHMPLSNCVERWVRSVSDGLAFRHLPNYMEVKYEDVIGNPEQTIRRVCDYLDVSFDDQMLNYHEFTGPSRDVMKFPQNIEATLPMYSHQVGRWKRELTSADLDQIMPEIDALLKSLDYPV